MGINYYCKIDLEDAADLCPTDGGRLSKVQQWIEVYSRHLNYSTQPSGLGFEQN